MSDKIEHPDHYKWHPSGVECVTIVQDFTYNLGTAIAYLWRAGRKTANAIEDLRKAQRHIDFEIARLEREERRAQTAPARAARATKATKAPAKKAATARRRKPAGKRR